jgi:AcrR family transcriptional regulator
MPTLSAPTKQRITEAAVRCFNRLGIANTRLQQVADEAGLSLGNMTYHFRNKEALGEAVWQGLVREQEEVLAEFRVLPLFEDIERLLARLFRLQAAYRFFYLDMLEVIRAFPQIRPLQGQHMAWQVQQMSNAVRFNQARGAFRSWPEAPEAERLAQQFWLAAELWRYRRRCEGAEDQDYAAFREAIWDLFKPWFSDMGLREFEQLQGENFSYL